ncbi:MAG: class II aldolase/adducin family protein [Bacteroidota bacterium]
MNEVSREQLERFVEACRDIARRGLVRCSCGNLSMRVDEESFLITSTGSWMERMTAEQATLCRTADGAVLRGKKPSSEIGFHAGILRFRPELNVVLHFQTPCATALACRKPDDLDYAVIPEVPYYIGPIGHVHYFTPGTDELAAAVTEAMRSHDMVLMANHGQVTAGRDYDQVVQNAEFFELACQILLIGGDAVAPMSGSAAESLRALRMQGTKRAC